MEAAKAVSYFDFISEIESDSAPLDESIDMLLLFGELLWDASRWLDTSKPYTIEVFNNRLNTLMSMHSMIVRELGKANQAMRAHITAALRQRGREAQHKDN